MTALMRAKLVLFLIDLALVHLFVFVFVFIARAVGEAGTLVRFLIAVSVTFALIVASTATWAHVV